MCATQTDCFIDTANGACENNNYEAQSDTEASSLDIYYHCNGALVHSLQHVISFCCSPAIIDECFPRKFCWTWIKY